MFISALVQVFMSVQPDGLVQGVWATRLSKLGPTVGSARSASSTTATGWTKVRSGTCTATTPTVSTSSRHSPFGLVAVPSLCPQTWNMSFRIIISLSCSLKSEWGYILLLLLDLLLCGHDVIDDVDGGQTGWQMWSQSAVLHIIFTHHWISTSDSGSRQVPLGLYCTLLARYEL